jgi:hypothetical protein
MRYLGVRISDVEVITIRLHTLVAESWIPKTAVTMERQTVLIPSSIYYATSGHFLSYFRKRCLKISPRKISLRYASFFSYRSKSSLYC